MWWSFLLLVVATKTCAQLEPQGVRKGVRTTWAHGANCDYRTAAGNPRVPRELPAVPGDQGVPLSSCGRGKLKDVEMWDRVLAVWRMLGWFVTRIALSPLFCVSHVEQILEPHDMFGMGRNTDSSLELVAELVPDQAPAPAPANALVSVSARGSKTDTVTMSGSDAGGPRGPADLKSVATCD